jgi:Flp pilus assembly protein CpaB
MMQGKQPIFRTTTKSIRAEEPIFEDELEPFAFAKPLSRRIKAGMRAVNLRLTSDHCEGGTIRVKDRVDVLCTMTNENFPGANSATVVIAKGVEVIPRTEAQQGVGFENKSYTVQATPFRASLIDLARKLGAEFSMVLSAGAAKEPDALDQKYGKDTVVTTKHLAELFGIKPPAHQQDADHQRRLRAGKKTNG